ncbi:MAG: transcriptional regulator [Nostoc sp. ChiQUE01a]|nr:transcriptional regulator [Nostoc sp. ChiQUE01a]
MSHKKFGAKLGVSFNTVNRLERWSTTSSPRAVKLIEDLSRSLGEPGKGLLKKYFSEGGLDV